MWAEIFLNKGLVHALPLEGLTPEVLAAEMVATYCEYLLPDPTYPPPFEAAIRAADFCGAGPERRRLGRSCLGQGGHWGWWRSGAVG